jgi:chemotaxis protein methyltransferase CheR
MPIGQMVKTISKIDALRHVRFAGQPPDSISSFPTRTKQKSPAAIDAQGRQSERPGQFISWLFHRAGLTEACYRGAPLVRRIPACLRALHCETEVHARQILEQRPELLPAAIGALLIGVTEFFRDPPVFETMRTEVLPQLASPARPLRVWSAGCSDGAELYSLAILLAQVGLLQGSFLLGSDCRTDAIERARSGLYKSAALKRIEPTTRCTYFEEVGSFWRPIEQLRRQVSWKVADIAREIEEGPWDIILWRNMAIYFTAETNTPLWERLASALASGGVLIVGKAERPPSELPLTNVKRCIYRSCSYEGSRFSDLAAANRK